VKLYVHSLVDKLKWFYENARCYSKIYTYSFITATMVTRMRLNAPPANYCKNNSFITKYNPYVLSNFHQQESPPPVAKFKKSFTYKPWPLYPPRPVVAQWLRHCATNRKVAGSIPDGAIEIFHWHNPSDRTMALGSTQPLPEMSTRSISWR